MSLFRVSIPLVMWLWRVWLWRVCIALENVHHFGECPFLWKACIALFLWRKCMALVNVYEFGERLWFWRIPWLLSMQISAKKNTNRESAWLQGERMSMTLEKVHEECLSLWRKSMTLEKFYDFGENIYDFIECTSQRMEIPIGQKAQNEHEHQSTEDLDNIFFKLQKFQAVRRYHTYIWTAVISLQELSLVRGFL